uniref:Abhydrolase domain containing 4, N-acyl phospholipase B n=1 Tax=Molossus molossus TaxID=27622 RepID=A0A7J8JPG3_MOLMO|nr:abhydrolase domain containing 4, N-acyl phospholipase B [Molossus molossus]
MADDLEQQPQGWLSSWLPAWRPTSMSQLKNVEARILQWPGLVQRFRPDFKRKFADFFEDDTISEYIYHCNAQNPSGETAFKAMMESFGWARRPMLERIHLIRKDVPITMIYGANTWIDTSTGKKVKLQRPDSYVRDMEIEGASHHVYADQPHIFNAMVEEICDSVD